MKLSKNFLNHFFIDKKLETSMKNNDFIFDFVNCITDVKINLNCSGSYIDSHNLIKTKKQQ